MENHLKITEVSPRDGFQILPQYIPLSVKAAFIQSLLDAGCEEIEASSFVSPKWVPQMSDSSDIAKQFSFVKRAVITYLVPNLKGAQRAIDAGAKQLFVTTSASAKHSQDNLNQTIEDVLLHAARIAELARQHNVVYTASIACAFGFSQDPEPISVGRVCDMASKLTDAGFTAITLCDTAGEANPANVKELCAEVLRSSGQKELGIHLHQAGGIEYANALAALEAGVRTFESAAGGMGGCPYIAKAKGNIATETLVSMFSSMGYATGIDLEKMRACGEQAKLLQATYGTKTCDLLYNK